MVLFLPSSFAFLHIPEWFNACTKRTNITSLVEQLHALTPKTVCKHFFVFSKGAHAGDFCNGWWKNPVPELRNAMRVAYSHFTFTKEVNRKSRKKDQVISYNCTNITKDKEQYPNLFSVPYPTSIHWGAGSTPATKGASKNETSSFATIEQPPWTTSNHTRDTLMLFIGSVKHGDVRVRKRIAELCLYYHAKVNEKLCPPEGFTGKSATSNYNQKGKATFCLEPGGDSPWRKSLGDSISFGCIPVLFHDYTDDVAPWSWGAWKNQARVLVPRDAFITGQIDLLKLLQSIPPKLLELMQYTLSRYAHQFQYSIDEYYPDDGIRVTLDGLKAQATSMEREGTCK